MSDRFRSGSLRSFLVLGCLVTGAASGPAAAQQPLGDEFLVNTVTTNGQRASAAAALPGGGFLVVWATETDGDQHGIAGRFVEPGGLLPDPEFAINTHTTGDQYRPAVATLAGGGFVVVWESDGSPDTDSDGKSVLARVYDEAGAPLAGEFQVNTYTTGYQYAPAVAALDGGGFVVTWWSYGFADSGYGSILARRYDSSGAELEDEAPVTDFDQVGEPVVAALPQGGFVVVWRSEEFEGDDTSGASVQGRRFDFSGAPQGGPFLVNTETTGDQDQPAVASDSAGNLFVVWRSGATLGLDFPEVRGRRYDPEGGALGGDFRLNSYTTSAQESPAVASDPSGAFTVSWESVGSNGSDDSGKSVQARTYTPGGTPLGTELQVNTLTTGLQAQPAVAADGSGELLVSWTHGGIGQPADSDVAVEAQRFAQPHVFSDGFERDATCRWSDSEGAAPCS